MAIVISDAEIVKQLKTTIDNLKKERDLLNTSITSDTAVLGKYMDDLKVYGIVDESELEPTIQRLKKELAELISEMQAGIQEIQDDIAATTTK